MPIRRIVIGRRASFHKLCELVERHPPAYFVVTRRQSGWQPVVNNEHTGAAVRVCECDRHFAAQGRVRCLELVYLDDPLVRH